MSLIEQAMAASESKRDEVSTVDEKAKLLKLAMQERLNEDCEPVGNLVEIDGLRFALFANCLHILKECEGCGEAVAKGLPICNPADLGHAITHGEIMYHYHCQGKAK